MTPQIMVIQKLTKSYNNWNTDKTAMSLTFPKKWWIESDFNAPNLKLSYTALQYGETYILIHFT
jgi:hypothetical protein